MVTQEITGTSAEMPLVYKITNTVNGQFYIGFTRRSLAARKANHFWCAAAGKQNVPKLYNAIRKYGKDSFEFEVLAAFEDLKLAMDCERETIEKLRPSYNLIAGGYGPSGHKWTPGQREKIVRASKGLKRSPETIAAMKAGKVGKAYGRKVVCLDDLAVHVSAREAAKFYKIGECGIRSVCYGLYQRTRSLHFEFFTVPLTRETADVKIKMLEAKTIEGSLRRSKVLQRPVFCLSSGEYFISGREAAKRLGISASRVMQLCQTGCATSAGVRCSYVDKIPLVEAA